jgi:type I restriction enzyme, S subunit
MSNKLDTKVVKPESKRVLKPKLRFPEFRGEPEWNTEKLGAIASLITERAGNRKCIPMSITSGVGLVSQQEKFGRTIAGNQYENYLVLQKDDFAYNKSATKEFPQGFIAKYSGDEPAAVPNSIFTCFRARKYGIVPDFLSYLFVGNLHGKWLKKYIEVSARAHGSLSIDDEILLSLPIPLPSGGSSLAEQQKIVACLTSLDELIGTHCQKLDALEAYKKGLMQQLFPREGETIPRFRFPEFQDSPEWTSDSLGNIFETSSGGTPERSVKEYWNGKIPWITTSLVDFNVIRNSDEFISEMGLKHSSAKLFQKNTVLIAMYGQGKTRGKVALLGIEATTNQACAAILPREDVDPYFVFLNLAGRYDEMRGLSNSGGQENLSQGLIKGLPFSYPNDIAEQQKLSACLSSFDELITAQKEKLEALKNHKKGLMQQLFPSSEEAL